MKSTMVLLIISASLAGCDAIYVVRGHVVADNSPSAVVSAQKFAADTTQPIEGAFLSFVGFQNDTSWAQSVAMWQERSDSLGRFFCPRFTNMRRHLGAIVTSDSGFIADTLFYTYGSGDTINAIIRLRSR